MPDRLVSRGTEGPRSPHRRSSLRHLVELTVLRGVLELSCDIIKAAFLAQASISGGLFSLNPVARHF